MIQTINSKYTRRYFDEFIRLSCAPDLLSARVFPDSKEISESMAAFSAIRRVLGHQTFGDATIRAVDVGCGGRPRTAALVACMTRWSVDAVDPQLNLEKSIRIERVTSYRAKMRDVVVAHDGLVVAICVHSHAPITEVLSAVQAPDLVIISMPCCVPHEIVGAPTVEWEDAACLSEKRRVKVWKLHRDPRGFWAPVDVKLVIPLPGKDEEKT